MAKAKRATADEREAARTRHLLALDAAALVRRLDKREGEMVELFGRKRDRAALVEPLRSWFHGAAFKDLVQLSTKEQRSVSRFYEAVDELRWYFQYTEDMPGTVRSHFDAFRREIATSYAALRDALGVEVELEPEDASDVIAEALRDADARGSRRRRG